MTDKKDFVSNKELVEIVKGVREMARQVALPANYLKNIVRPLNKFAKEQKRIIESFSKMNESAIRTAQISMSQAILESQKFIVEAVKKISDFAEFQKKLRQIRDEEKTALIETGWIICPSLMSIPYPNLRKAVVNYNQGDNGKSISNLMKNHYGSQNNWEYLTEVVAKWESHKLFTKQRMRIIKDALWAHKNKKYTLSIPSLLPIIEGVATDYCKRKKTPIPENKTIEKAKKTAELLGLQGEQYMAEILLSFIENQLYVHTKKLRKSKNKKLLNRHGVLHGYYSGYPDATRSLKCFLVLDVLSSLSI